MQPHEKIKSYVSLVCDQIRWKKARVRVAEEMEGHVIDQRDSFIAQGLSEEAATDKAISNTGDATLIGAQLDRTHRPKPQWTMLGATLVLLLLGLLVRVFVFTDEDRVGLLSERLFFSGIGIAGMLIAYFLDFSILGKYPKTVYFAVAALSVAVLIASPIINGRSYYTPYMILLFPLAFALAVYAAKNRGYIGIILCGLAFVLLGFIALLAPFMSGFLHFAVVGVALMCTAIWRNWFGVKRRYCFMLTLAPVAVLAFLFISNMNTYMLRRISAAFNPYADSMGSGYWSVMTRELISGAKLFGQGDIPAKYYTYLTEPSIIFYTDSLLTALISLVGWVAFAVIVSIMLFFIIKGFILCSKQKSSLGFFVSFSVMMTFAMQAASYVLFNLGFQLLTPISLPLISYGNTATIINMALIGFMLSVFRTGDAITDRKFPAAPAGRLSVTQTE